MNHTQALEVVDVAPAPVALFRASEPAGIVAQATAVANALAKVIRDRGLYTSIQGRDHVRVEGWTLLGTMLGVFPVTAWCRPCGDGHCSWAKRASRRVVIFMRLPPLSSPISTEGSLLWSSGL